MNNEKELEIFLCYMLPPLFITFIGFPVIFYMFVFFIVIKDIYVYYILYLEIFEMKKGKSWKISRKDSTEKKAQENGSPLLEWPSPLDQVVKRKLLDLTEKF